MNVTPLPVYVPGARPFAFRRLLQRIPGAEPRQFRPMRAGRFIVSIQASELHASSPAGAPPPEDVDAFEVSIFTNGDDGNLPWTVSPRSHPHLFRDGRWAHSWVPRADDDGTFWAGYYIPTHVVSDLLTCLADPARYAARLASRPTPPARS